MPGELAQGTNSHVIAMPLRTVCGADGSMSGASRVSSAECLMSSVKSRDLRKLTTRGKDHLFASLHRCSEMRLRRPPEGY